MSSKTNPNYNWDLAILTFVILVLLFFWFYKFLFINNNDDSTKSNNSIDTIFYTSELSPL